MLALAWKAIILLGAAHVAALGLRRRSAAERHFLWILVMLGLLSLPWLDSAAPKLVTFAPAIPMETVLTPDEPGLASSTINTITPAVAPGNWTPLLWACGAALVFGYQLLGLILLGFRFRDSRPLSITLPDMGRLPDMGLQRVCAVRESPACAVPMTWGVFRPVIMLPLGATQWPAERLRSVLLHEMMHIRRWDFGTQWLANIATAAYWWNPLAWLAARAMRRDQELACDDGVLRLGAPADCYAGHLLDVARGHAAATAAPAAALSMASHLEDRIRAALDPRVARHAVRTHVGLALAGVLALVLLPLAGTRIAAQANGGRVQGSVLDSSGAAVPQTVLFITSADGKRREFTRSGEDGRYDFPLLPEGAYTVEARKPGFALLTRSGITVNAGQNQNLDLTLQVGKVQETLDIVGKKPTTLAAAPMRTGTPKRIRVGGNVQATKILRMTRPQYPQHLQQQGIEGTVLLEGVISLDGSLLSLRSQNSLVHPELTKAAIEAVQQWKYQPTLLNGQPVEIITTIQVNFRLAE